jgi:flagellar motility protein MotE (MotC chaperone)
MRLLNLRLIPIVTLAAAALFVLKVSGLLLDSGYALIASRAANAQGMAMPPVVDLDAQVRPRPSRTTVVTTTARRGDRKPPPAPPETTGAPETTGSVPAAKPEASHAAKPPAKQAAQAPPPAPGPGTIDLSKPPMTAGERAVLESLVQRRQELEARAREIDVRENLLKAAEQRVEARLQELQEAEAKLNGAVKKRDEAEVAKFKNLVTMYENMKPKDAAKVFDRLDMRVLIEVVGLMNPRRMSDILALMTPEAAEKLTIEIANRSGPDRAVQPAELPKIDGSKPNKT